DDRGHAGRTATDSGWFLQRLTGVGAGERVGVAQLALNRPLVVFVLLRDDLSLSLPRSAEHRRALGGVHGAAPRQLDDVKAITVSSQRRVERHRHPFAGDRLAHHLAAPTLAPELDGHRYAKALPGRLEEISNGRALRPIRKLRAQHTADRVHARRPHRTFGN